MSQDKGSRFEKLMGVVALVEVYTCSTKHIHTKIKNIHNSSMLNIFDNALVGFIPPL